MGQTVEIGQILAGKYRVDRVLGEGGFGVVVAATHLQLGQRVALKFLLPEALRSPEIQERFLREARAVVRLQSAHAARVLDIGHLPDGVPYIVMEYLEGRDLSAVLEQQGRVPAPTAAGWIIEACEAIGEAHGLGIIHRDLKPGNLFLARGPGGAPTVKVLDFGISKVAEATEENHSLTRTNAVLGSPVYASPEQLRSTKYVDARTDVWALGITLYQLVSGTLPYLGQTLSEICMKVAVDPVPPLPMLLGLPLGFEAVVLRCLAKDPGDRFPDVAALASALVPFAGDEYRAAARRVSGALGVTVMSESQRADAAPRPRSPATISGAAGEARPAIEGTRRHLWPFAVAGAMVVASAAGIIFTRGGMREDRAAAVPTATAVPSTSMTTDNPPPPAAVVQPPPPIVHQAPASEPTAPTSQPAAAPTRPAAAVTTPAVAQPSPHRDPANPHAKAMDPQPSPAPMPAEPASAPRFTLPGESAPAPKADPDEAPCRTDDFECPLRKAEARKKGK